LYQFLQTNTSAAQKRRFPKEAPKETILHAVVRVEQLDGLLGNGAERQGSSDRSGDGELAGVLQKITTGLNHG